MTSASTTTESTSPANGSLSNGVRSVDRDLLLCLRSGEPRTIGELTEMLGVTATAVRQRVERLMEMGLMDREKIVAGRGRPTFRYLLTVAGYRRAGADAVDLAEAMWQEILSLESDDIREQLVNAIALRLGRQFAASLPSNISFTSRMESLSGMLQNREIPASVQLHGDLPVLDIDSCPYPNLTDASSDRTMCRLEEKMLSEALGEPVHLSSCRLDGDSCCQFSRTT